MAEDLAVAAPNCSAPLPAPAGAPPVMPLPTQVSTPPCVATSGPVATPAGLPPLPADFATRAGMPAAVGINGVNGARGSNCSAQRAGSASSLGAAASAASHLAAGRVPSASEPKITIGVDWDTPRVPEQDQPSSPCNRTFGTFNCTRGGMGVTGLSLQNVHELGAKASAETVSGSLQWARGEMLGRGSLGTVFQAMNKDDGTVFAVKEVQINQQDESDMKWKAELQNEVTIGKALGKHKRIVTYLGHDYIDSCLYIYLEFMAGGSVAQVLQEFGAFEESLCISYSKALLEGLDYLHTREPPIVHRDVKGGNVLLGLDCQVKLSDFGCSKRTMETMSHTMKGSIPWMAPEVVTNVGYGRMADIWSFGCVVIEMASGSRPWGKLDNPMAAMYKIGMSQETPPVPDGLSSECKEFINLCVQRDSSLRPTSKKLLEHALICDVLVD